MADSDFLRILAGIAFCHRCRIKGLCVRSPARRLARPLASATVGVFRSYRRSGRGYFAPRARERVSDGSLLSTATKVTKSAGRNCVSALPQRATVGCDFPHLLAGITFHHRCQSKGLRVRSPARRLTRPLASATAGVFRSYRHPPKPSPRVAHPLKPSPWGVLAVLNDTPVACQIREPTRRETGAPISRRRQPPPTHCGASRRNGRDLIIANPVEANTPTVTEASGRVSLRAGERTRSPFDRQ